jgi:rhodanese-related sulfurtransferase
MTDSITVTALEALLKDKEKMTLLDVRRKSDYLATPRKISSAHWQDPENTGAWAKQWPTDRLTVVYLEGGLNAWVENGGAVE